MYAQTDPIFVIPLFFNSGSAVRLLICLLVHPILLEAGEAIGRGTRGDAVALALKKGTIKTYEEAADLIVESSLSTSFFKFLMVCASASLLRLQVVWH